MKPHTLEDLYQAKRARRLRLAKLPIDERIDLIEKLHEMGKSLIEARKSLPVKRKKGG
ncbi:MAG: hypothetical protein ABSE62_04520 [Chthoniobacteraceae bacterium]